ncbi:unnamed protein product [Closterium sp. Naga37s-1]|nr:unnamed protein product [Closterium sp. Naga37s-1]
MHGPEDPHPLTSPEDPLSFVALPLSPTPHSPTPHSPSPLSPTPHSPSPPLSPTPHSPTPQSSTPHSPTPLSPTPLSHSSLSHSPLSHSSSLSHSSFFHSPLSHSSLFHSFSPDSPLFFAPSHFILSPFLIHLSSSLILLSLFFGLLPLVVERREPYNTSILGDKVGDMSCTYDRQANRFYLSAMWFVSGWRATMASTPIRTGGRLSTPRNKGALSASVLSPQTPSASSLNPPPPPSNDGINSNPDWRAPLHFNTSRLTTLCGSAPMPMVCALMPMPCTNVLSCLCHAPMSSHAYAMHQCPLMPMPCTNVLSCLCHAPMSSHAYAMHQCPLMPMPCTNVLSCLCHAPMSSHAYAMHQCPLMPMPCTNVLSCLCHAPMSSRAYAIDRRLCPSFSIWPQKVAADGEYDYHHDGTVYFGWTAVNSNPGAPNETVLVGNYTTIGAFAITGTSALGTPEAESRVEPHCAAVNTPPFFEPQPVKQKPGPVPTAWRLNTTIKPISPTFSNARGVVVFPESRHMWVTFMSGFGNDMSVSAVVARLRLSLRPNRKWRTLRVFLERFKVVGVGGGNSLIQPSIALNRWEGGEWRAKGREGG